MSLELTARGSGYFRVFVNGEEVSRHTTEREAVEEVMRRAVGVDWSHTAIYYDHDYVVDARPSSVPQPEPEPPPPAPGPPTDGVVIDFRNIGTPFESNGEFYLPLLDLPGYEVTGYESDIREFEVTDSALRVNCELAGGRTNRGVYVIDRNRRRNLVDARPDILGCNRMEIVFRPPEEFKASNSGVVKTLARWSTQTPEKFVESLHGPIEMHNGDYHNKRGRTSDNPETANQHYYNMRRFISKDQATTRLEHLGDRWLRFTVSLMVGMQQRGGSNQHRYCHDASRYGIGPEHGMVETLSRFYFSLMGRYGRWSSDWLELATMRFFHEPETLTMWQDGSEAVVTSSVDTVGIPAYTNTAGDKPSFRDPIPLAAGEEVRIPLGSHVTSMKDANSLSVASVKREG